MPWRKRASGVISKRSMPERRPVALSILDQLVGLRDPHCAAAALQPVVEQDARDLAALAGAGAVAQHPAAPEAHRVLGIIGCRRDDIEGLIDHPRSGEMAAVGLAGIDDALELGIGQHAVGDDIGRQARSIGRLGRCHRSHRCGLHEPRRMRARIFDANRLQAIGLVQRLGDAAVLGRLPVDSLIGEFGANGLERCCRARPGAWRRCGLGADRDDARSLPNEVGSIDRQARRHVLQDPGEQRGRIRRHARGRWKRLWIRVRAADR